MPQIELWHEIVSCKHTPEQIEHGVNANYGYYPAGDAEQFDDADARQDSADEAGNG